MAILASVRGHLKILGILPLSSKDLPFALQKYKSFINRAYNFFWHISLTTYLLTATCFLLFDATTFLEYTETAFFMAVTFLHLSSHIILFRARSDLIVLFNDFDEIVEKRSVDPAIRRIYAQHDEETAKLSKSLFKSGFILAEMFLFPYAAQSFYLYYTTDLGEDSFMPLFPSKIPWNWRTPFGYLIAVSIQYIWIHCGIFSIVSSIPLFAGSCSLLGAFTLDLNTNLNDLNDDILKQATTTNRLNLFKKLAEFASFHSTIKRLAARFSEICSSLIAVSFGVSSIFLCSSLLGLNASNTIDDIMRYVVCLGVMMAYLVVLCLMGDDMTISFRQIHDSIWECTWYELPLKAQKLLPMILAAAEKPVYIQGYMNTRCTRESVKKLLNAAVSYFMVLREFDH